MHDAALVRRRQRVGQRDREIEHARKRKSARRHQPVEALSLDQLHGQEADPVRLLDRVERDDVRVVERRDGLGLALEARQAVGMGGHVLGQHLDRDLAAEPRVARAIDLAHPARAERRDDLVGAEPGAWR